MPLTPQYRFPRATTPCHSRPPRPIETDDVIAVTIGDHPGGLEEVLEVIEAQQINLEYLYSVTRPASRQPVLVCSFADPDAALAAL